jgi:hypothetical protein
VASILDHGQLTEFHAPKTRHGLRSAACVTSYHLG